MEIFYKNRKIENQLTDPIVMIKSFGQMARKINQRLEDFKASDNLAILKTLPAARCHELTGRRKGELAVDISGNFRLIFAPYHSPVPQKLDGGMNWEEITRIIIINIEDYH